MKIAHVCPFYKPAICGVGQVVYELAQRQIKEGHEVYVYTSDWDKTKRIGKKEEIIEGVYVHRCYHWFRAVNFVTIWPSVFFKLLGQKFDVVHSHIPNHAHALLAGFVAKIKKIRHIHTTHCPWTEGYRNKFGVFIDYISKYTYIPILFKIVDKVIAITPWEIEFLLKYGCDKNKITVIPNGMSDILYKKVENNNFRKILGISDKDKLVLFFGRLNVTKGIDKLIHVAQEITKERKDIYFVFRGPDEGMRYLVEDAAKKNKNIVLIKETRDKEEIAKTYQAADVYVLPSYREGLPLTLFEAMASGLPIIASPVNGIPYEMKEPENGFLIQYGNIENLKKRILQILDDKELAKKISENNKIKAKGYDWDLIYRKTMGLYKS
jgi:glycosyltransferase involved in cell wall biosynthesis